MLRGGRAIE